MNATSNTGEKPPTLWDWLDAFAKGTTPLPRYSLFPPLPKRAASRIRTLCSILAWSLTLLMLQALGIGLTLTSLFYAAGGWGYFFGGYGWLITGAAVAISGTLALVCMGRYAAAAAYLVCSPITSIAFMVPHIGLSTITPMLVIPPAVLLNGAYFYVAWRFLSPQVERSVPEGNP
jgi:hypothetical protein